MVDVLRVIAGAISVWYDGATYMGMGATIYCSLTFFSLELCHLFPEFFLMEDFL